MDKVLFEEESFIEYVRALCAGCSSCGTIDFKKYMVETEGIYYCTDCEQE